MATSILRLLTLFFILFSSSAFGQLFQYEQFIVEKIDIAVMNPPSGSTFNPSAVISRIKTKEGDIFSQGDFDSDLKTLAQEYDRVEPSIEVVDQKVFIRLKIWLKPHIRTIRWNGNTNYSNSELQNEFGISPGSVFDRLAFTKAFHKLKAYYVKKGFFEAELDYDIEQDPISNEVDLCISINEGRCGKIQDIVFHNFTSQEEDDILEMIVTKEWSLFTSWLTNDGIYSEEAIQQDQYLIVNYLQNEGYADAKVFIEIGEARARNRIVINVTAEKGQLFTIGKLSVEGNKLFTDEQIFAQFTICENAPYSPERIRQTIQNISNLYGTQGYIEAVIDYEPELECDQPVYAIHFTIEEGDQYNIGLIKVFGNCSTQTNVILHESLLIPGEVFNITKLQKTEERLRNIGYFKCVNVYAVRTTEDPCSLGANYRDVHIEVEETNTGNFSAFFGFSNVESLFGGFHITEKNFNYKGLGRVWRDGYRALRGGGEYAHFTTSIGNKSRSYVLSWTKPYFRDTPWIVGFDVERSNVRYISNEYEIDSWGGTLHAKYPINPYLRFGCHYRLRYSDVNVEGNGNRNPLLVQEAKNDGIVSAAGVSLIYDSTDSPTKPSCGFRSRGELEYAGLGGKYTFFGLGYLNTFYYAISKKGIFKIRGDLKFILPVFDTNYGNMPLDERLYLGGDNTVRGYRSYALGPKFPGTEDPRGGLSLNLFSLEYVYRFSKKWEGFSFFDAGHLSQNRFSLGGFKSSVGFGLRFAVFEGGPPITVGMGFPLNDPDRSDIKRFFFNVGGSF